jgi:HK97 family phage major capsid protein
MNDIVSFITRDVVEALGKEIDSQVFNGAQFTGVLGAATNSVTFGASNTATSYADMVSRNFYDAIFKLPSVRRSGAKFYLPKELLPYIQSLTTGTGGVPLMSMLGGAQTATIGGYPFMEVEAIDGTDATSTDYVCFGNLQNYALGVRLLPNSVELNPYAGTEFKQFEVLFRMYARLAGAPVFNDLFVAMATA